MSGCPQCGRECRNIPLSRSTVELHRAQADFPPKLPFFPQIWNRSPFKHAPNLLSWETHPGDRRRVYLLGAIGSLPLGQCESAFLVQLVGRKNRGNSKHRSRQGVGANGFENNVGTFAFASRCIAAGEGPLYPRVNELSSMI